MRTPAKLFTFAVLLASVLGVYRVVGWAKGKAADETTIAVAVAPEPPHPPSVPLPPTEVPDAAMAPPAVQVSASNAATAPGELRIFTSNQAAYLSLINDNVTAGLSDSLRQSVLGEVNKEMSKEDKSKLGKAIVNMVSSSLENVLSKKIEIPVSEIESVELRDNTIVFAYKRGEAPNFIKFEDMKGDKGRPFLSQFAPGDAEKFVAAVRKRLK